MSDSGQCASVACRIQNFHSVAHLKAPFRYLPAGGTNKKSCRKPTGHKTHQTHGRSSESLPVSLYRFLKVSSSLPTIAQGEAVVKGFSEFCRKSFCTVNGQGRFSQKGTASRSRMKSAVVDGIKSPLSALRRSSHEGISSVKWPGTGPRGVQQKSTDKVDALSLG